MAFYEIRQYKIHPGRMAEWVRIMEEEIVPFQVSKGMVICGLFRGETDDSVWFWIRRFESEAQREQQYKDVYESDYWKTKIAPKTPEYVGAGREHHQPRGADAAFADAVTRLVSLTIQNSQSPVEDDGCVPQFYKSPPKAGRSFSHRPSPPRCATVTSAGCSRGDDAGRCYDAGLSRFPFLQPWRPCSGVAVASPA